MLDAVVLPFASPAPNSRKLSASFASSLAAFMSQVASVCPSRDAKIPRNWKISTCPKIEGMRPKQECCLGNQMRTL